MLVDTFNQLNASLVGRRHFIFFLFYLPEALFAVNVYIQTFYLQPFPGGKDAYVANLSLLKKQSLLFLFTFLRLHRNSPLIRQAPRMKGYKPPSFRKCIVSEATKMTSVTRIVACGL